MLPIGPAILALRLLTRQNGGGGTTAWRPPTSVPNFRRVAWVLLVIAWSLELVVVVGLLAAMIAPAPTSKILELAGFALIGVFGGAYLFAAFPILRALARLGKPRLVYYLAHLSLVCQRTGETYAGATLLAALALAHRGNVSEQECAWLVSRLAKERRALGTFATARAMTLALLSRVARAQGQIELAEERGELARALFGTVTYLSSHAVAPEVRDIAVEWLALRDAELANWFMFMQHTTREPPVYLALRGWVKDRLMGGAATKAEVRARDILRGPQADAWKARAGDPPKPATAAEARDLAAQTYTSLCRGGAVSMRTVFAMLWIYDRLLDPADPDSIIPVEGRGDEALVTGIQDRLAQGISAALAIRGAPLFSMVASGPISSRVFHSLEVTVIDDLTKALTRWEERSKTRIRRTAVDDWEDAATLRMLFRRLEITLGPAAAARYFARYNSIYWKLGSELSEQEPRMRPLAHAIFAALQTDAARFGDTRNLPSLSRNVWITSGAT